MGLVRGWPPDRGLTGATSEVVGLVEIPALATCFNRGIRRARARGRYACAPLEGASLVIAAFPKAQWAKERERMTNSAPLSRPSRAWGACHGGRNHLGRRGLGRDWGHGNAVCTTIPIWDAMVETKRHLSSLVHGHFVLIFAAHLSKGTDTLVQPLITVDLLSACRR